MAGDRHGEEGDEQVVSVPITIDVQCACDATECTHRAALHLTVRMIGERK